MISTPILDRPPGSYTNHGRFKPDDPIFKEGLKFSSPLAVRQRPNENPKDDDD